MKNLYISDLDGTLVKRSISVDFLNWMCDKGIVKGCHDISKWKDNYLDDELHGRLVKTFYKELKGVPYHHLVKLATAFMKDYKRWCDLTKGFNMIDKSNTIIISGSPDFLVKAFCNEFNIYKGYGCHLYLDKDGKVDGARLRTFDAHTKSSIIESLMDNGDIDKDDYIVGLGDTKHDKGIFDYTNEAYLITPTEETIEWYFNFCNYNEDVIVIK